MNVTREDKGDVVVLRLQGHLIDAPEGGDPIGDAVHQAMGEGKHKILLDLHEVPFLSSTGLGVLVANYTRLKREGGTLRFLKPSRRVRSLFPLVAPLFQYFEDERVALESFEHDE